MEVVAQTPNGNVGPPFHNHDVREWSRIDNLTGVLERARFETDHWTANTINSSHKYGKVVDSRARSNADGALQQRARRQLEVFESSVPGGRLQVIKSHTVSSSRWTSKSSVIADTNGITQQFEDLNLSLNPLDLSSQKSKATVGRSVGRRPPSRPRARDESSIKLPTSPLTHLNSSDSVRLHRVSRLCNQIHVDAVQQTIGKYLNKPLIHERENGDGIEITEIEDSTNAENETLNEHFNLVRTKSTSSEALHSITSETDKSNKSIEDLEDLKQLQTWRRTSKIRRSLQLPKQNKASSRVQDLPLNTGSVRKIREDLETGRRLSTALRGNNVDLEALDHILQSISSTNSSDKNSLDGDKVEKTENQISIKKQKRDSFVTVESLQEVKGRLRRTSSPTQDIYKIESGDNVKKQEDTDDGIVTEESFSKQINNMSISDNLPSASPVRSYIFGMNKKSMIGTGSLESRSSKQSNGVLSYRNDDWYNRRKSYGFEEVHNQQQPINSKLKNKDVIESSTDSGICRSGEIVQTPTYNKCGLNKTKFDFSSDSDSKGDRFNSNSDNYSDISVKNVGNVKRYTTIFEKKKEFGSPLSNRKFNDLDFYENEEKKNIEGTSITIPITNRNSLQNGIDENKFSGFKLWTNGEIKRHSIAVDESKYVMRSTNMFRPTSLAVNDKNADNQFIRYALEDDALIQNKKPKKVEFCKTEVHFAAESGRVNIVATDEKPPPTNNFRRRRRNSGIVYDQLLSEANKNGLPMLHFGDSSYEKTLLGVNDHNDNSEATNKMYSENDTTNVVTISTNQSYHYQQDVEENLKDVENEVPKGILKNKPIKPKPYLLGDDNFFTKHDEESEDSKPWGVKLKPVPNKEEVPMWKSTVTLKNTLFEKQKNKNYSTADHNYSDLFSQNNVKPMNLSENDNLPSKRYDRIQIVHPNDPTRDKGNKLEEGRGFSTKVNIGSGEATVVSENQQQVNERHPTWPRYNESPKDAKNHILNKALIVRIGRTKNNSHTICSKTTADDDSNNAMTTTKITIDLSPSPTNDKKIEPIRPSDSLFKSTSLILNTFKSSETTNSHFNNEESYKNLNVPEQLEVLRKLYEDWHSDTEADKEVQLLMNNEESSLKNFENDNSSLSGSWSKMRAFKHMKQQQRSSKASNSSVFKSHAQVAKEYSSSFRDEDFTGNNGDMYPCKDSPKVDEKPNRFVNYRTPHSPVVLRKGQQTSQQDKLKTAHNNEKLSSPFLVVQNVNNEYDKPEKLQDLRQEKHVESCDSDFSRLIEKKSPIPNQRTIYSNKKENRSPTPEKHCRYGYANRKELSSKDASVNGEYVTIKDKERQKDVGKERPASPSKSVLRNPKKSEMAYFGIKTTTTAKNVQRTTKPKLPQSPKEKVSDTKFSKPESYLHIKNQPESHIYENIGKTRYKSKNGVKEFDSSVLDELTKAADQILQAVNDYAEESHLQDLENEKANCNERLDTICETKSWNEKANSKYRTFSNEVVSTKSKIRTSSTSSIDDSISETKKLNSVYRVSDSEKYRKKVNAEVSSTRAATKARRLQRASSREALLQSHGSSSEDLPVAIEVPVRKPRLVRKTKSSQNYKPSVEVNKSINYYNKKRDDKKRNEESMSVGALPEIRHKTAISTIRSTAEKNLSKERLQKFKNEEKAKKDKSKKDSTKIVLSPKVEKTRNTSSKDSINHRISTANIKKCARYERSTKP